MLWYLENASAKQAYADQEIAAWDGDKGTLPKAVVDEREAKLAAVEAAAAVKVDPNEKLPADTELVDALKAEALTHTLGSKITNPTCVCSWDGVSPYVIVLSGAFPKNGVLVMGWPQTEVVPPKPTPPTEPLVPVETVEQVV